MTLARIGIDLWRFQILLDFDSFFPSRDTEPIPKAIFEGENREQGFSFLKNRIKPGCEEIRPQETSRKKTDKK
jgi:hypothetical protein